MTTRAQVVAFHAVVSAQGADTVRMALATADAVELATELEGDEARHAGPLAVALAAYAKPDMPPSDLVKFPEAVLAWAERAKKRAADFWDAFEGEVIDGVEIIRRR